MELTKEQIVEGNKLLAEFMDYKYIPFNNDQNFKAGWWKKDILQQVKATFPDKLSKDFYLCRNNNELKYNSDWNWIMEVVDKIEDLDYDVEITNTSCLIIDSGWIYDMFNIVTGSKLKSTFKSCVEFVKWYNDTK